MEKHITEQLIWPDEKQNIKIICPECKVEADFSCHTDDGDPYWKIEPQGNDDCDTCDSAWDQYSYRYDTKKECLTEWPNNWKRK